MSMKCKIIPMDDENVVMEVEGELWARSSNPIARLIGFICKCIGFVFGYRKSAYMVMTTRRIIFFKKSVLLWCFPTATESYSVLPQAICSVGYTRRGTFLGCFCPMYCLRMVDNSGSITDLQLKGASENETVRYANAMYDAIKSK